MEGGVGVTQGEGINMFDLIAYVPFVISTDRVKWLIAAPCKCRVNDDGFAPLDVAVMLGYHPIIKMLLLYGAQESSKCKLEVLPLRTAVESFPFFYCQLSIGHFQVPPRLCIKTRLSVQLFIWNWFFILLQVNLIFTRKVEHLASFRKRVFLELGSGLFSAPSWCIVLGKVLLLQLTDSQT